MNIGADVYQLDFVSKGNRSLELAVRNQTNYVVIKSVSEGTNAGSTRAVFKSYTLARKAFDAALAWVEGDQ